MFAWHLSSPEWGLLVGGAAFYLATCVRMAYHMARTGRSFWLWLVITIFATSIPATAVLFRDRSRALGQQLRTPERSGSPRSPGIQVPGHQGDEVDADVDRAVRCGQCGRRLAAAEIDRTGPVPTCPHCHLPIPDDREKLA
jgi:DNA-directed RNA polymerase subunit RPC12/RpoP